MKAGRELDALVAEKVMGWIVNRSDSRHWHTVGTAEVANPHRQVGNRCCAAHPFNPSQDISAAWEVVEKLAALGFDMELRTFSEGVVVEFRDYEKPTNDDADGRAAVDPREGGAPLAIALAALKAVGAEVPA